ncbi:hypothetical protein EHS25_009234 [Saitozyma podzolica]|uniref:G-patch domain-containing protein n=1 Tax=Saitozyma podzolica TaxID=1890683 RepID=A0A427YL80_9TREE|nr:hypothetical protein EHS25_009234 [Saitozyma podzolica]
MTAPRRVRPGLGFPDAVIIRSTGGPSAPVATRDLADFDQHDQHDDEEQQHPHQLQPDAEGIRPGPSNPTTQVHTYRPPRVPPPKWDSYAAWVEWNTNPSHHGPDKVTRPPIFVSSQTQYDELGRSVLDGVQVTVDEGKKREGEGGESVADWYKALSAGTTRASTPAGGSSRTRGTDLVSTITDAVSAVPASTMTGPEPALASAPASALAPLTRPSSEPTSTASSSIILGTLPPPSPPPEPPAPSEASHPPSPPPPLRVHPSEWFIRRALLTSSRSSAAPSPPSGPSSIGTLLEVAPTQPRVAPAHYVLGPENRGYALLRDRLGWEGGGLGRSAVRDGDGEGGGPAVSAGGPSSPGSLGSLLSALPARTGVEGRIEGKSKGKARKPTAKSATEEVKVELDINGRPIVDLTGSSPEPLSDSPGAASAEADDDDFDVPISTPHGGPGRTAPVATTLKLDRLGIGHRRSQPKENLESSKRKVTHTAADIREAQRRARYGHPRHGVELGKKGKVKWKERDRREREERKRLAAAINA